MLLARSVAVVALLSAPSAWAEDEVAELSAAALEAHAQVEQEYVSLLRERRAGITAGSTTPGNDQVPEYFSIRQETKCSAQKYDYFVYAGLSDGVNWEDANSFCTNPIGFNGHLASIECEEENIFANQLAKLYGGPNQVMWLGGSRRNGNVGKKTFTSMVPDVSWYVANTIVTLFPSCCISCNFPDHLSSKRMSLSRAKRLWILRVWKKRRKEKKTPAPSIRKDDCNLPHKIPPHVMLGCSRPCQRSTIYLQQKCASTFFVYCELFGAGFKIMFCPLSSFCIVQRHI